MKPVHAAVGLTALIAASACTSSGSAATSSSTSKPTVVATTSPVPVANNATANNSPQSAGSSSAKAAAPPSGRIVFRRYGDDDKASASLFVVNVDGTHERALNTLNPAHLDYETNWSPDGKRVIFTRNTGDAEGVNEARQLFSIPGEGGKETELTPRGPAPGDVVPGWDTGGDYSPDERHIAYVHEWGARDPIGHSDVYVADADGKHPRRITHFPDASGSTAGPRWSPDGKRLVFSRFLSDSAQPAGGEALFIVDADGSHLHRLTSWSAMAGGDPDWSRATNLIAFRSAPEDSGIGNVFTIRPDGTGLTQVTHFTNQGVSRTVGFSPDGSWLVFSTAPAGDDNNQVTVAAIDGSSVRQVTHSQRASSSPDWTS